MVPITKKVPRMLHRFTLLIGVGVPAFIAFGFNLWLNRQQIPQSTYRIGYENNPPNMVVGADGKLGGLAIEIVREAARRADIRLEWIRYEGSGSPMLKGVVDLWPLMADFPGLRRTIHLTDPWLQTHYALLYRVGEVRPTPSFRGPIGRYSQTLHGRLLRQQYPQATDKSYPSREAIVKGLCQGEVDAAFMEERAASRFLSVTETQATPCAMQSELIAGAFVQFSLASSKKASGVADRIREKIGEMARDGTLTIYLSSYANSEVHDATAAFDLAQVRQRARWLEILASCLIVVLVVVFWQNRRILAARRVAEQAGELLRTRESHFRTLLEHSADLIAVIDRNNVITYVSPSSPHVLGWESCDLMGKNLQDLLHAEDRQVFEAAIANMLLQVDLPLRIRFRLLHREKDYCTFQAFVRWLPQGGGPASVLINGHDITSESRLQEQLQQAQKMEAVGRLAGGIAHDFNNLLTVINGYSQMLIARARTSDPVVEKLNQILKAGERAARLTQQLLAFSRKQVIVPRNVDLNVAIIETLEMLHRVMGEDITISTVLDPELGTVLVDPDQMNQVIMNLAVNARDAIPHGGKLLLETQNVALGTDYVSIHPEVIPGRYVLMAVTDTGIGMDNATMQCIFEPFFTTKRTGKGTGLGLATVHGIVRQSGGWVWVYSEPGKGTTFKIYLPRTDARPEAAQSEVAPALMRMEGRTILVVEDEDEVRLLMLDVLRGQGYRVLPAVSGEDAMRVAEEYSGSIDLLLTDVVLPGITGPQLAERLRPLREGFKVLYTSGYTENVVVHHGVLKPGFRYLPKPFTPEGLALKVHDILR